MDGSRSPHETLAATEPSFAPILDANRGPVDVRPVRRWENDVFAANVRSWLASPDAPAEAPAAYAFACECGGRGCSAQVELTLADYESTSQVIATEHGPRDWAWPLGSVGTVRIPWP